MGWFISLLGVNIFIFAILKPCLSDTICSRCTCIGFDPFEVNCMNMDLTEVPLDTSNHTFPWKFELQNNLIETVPQFAPFHQLFAISLKHNDIIQIEDSAFKDLPQLQSLDLSNNKLDRDALKKDIFRGKYSDKAVEPIGLKTLDLSHNNIESLDDDAFQHLRNLTELRLSNNNLHDLSMNTAAAFADLPELTLLDLSYTGLSRLPAHFLSDHKHLDTIILSNNRFKTVPVEVNFIRTLQVLNLNSNPIDKIRDGDFTERLKYLQELQLSAMDSLRLVEPNAFKHLISLRHLEMINNKNLKEILPGAFAKEKITIEQLELQGNGLITLNENLIDWLSIKEVNIQDNPWSCDCNFQWVKDMLIVHLEKNNPTLSLNIICAGPEKVQGMNVKDIDDGYKWECTSPETYNQYQGAIVMTVIIIGSLLLLVGTIVFAHLLFKNSQIKNTIGQTVKYRRTFNEDEEAVTDSVQT